MMISRYSYCRRGGKGGTHGDDVFFCFADDDVAGPRLLLATPFRAAGLFLYYIAESSGSSPLPGRDGRRCMCVVATSHLSISIE